MQVPDFDLYRELEVDPSAGRETIEAAYRALIKRDHPDKGAASAKATRLNVAREWLTHADRRALYDAARETPTPRREDAPAVTRGLRMYAQFAAIGLGIALVGLVAPTEGLRYAVIFVGVAVALWAGAWLLLLGAAGRFDPSVWQRLRSKRRPGRRLR